MTESDAPSVIGMSVQDNTNTLIAANSASTKNCNTTITVTFNEPMDKTSLTTNTLNRVCSGSIQVSDNSSTFFSSCVRMTSASPASSDNETFTLTPSAALSNSTTYKIRVTTGAKDPSGNTMESDNTTGNGFITSGDNTKLGC
jgi:hypothetical protein